MQPDGAALPVLDEAVTRVVPQLTPQELANLMWALGSLRIRPAALASLETAVTRVFIPSHPPVYGPLRLVTSLPYASVTQRVSN